MAVAVVKLVAALARNRTIGRDNSLPWHLPEDLKRFRRLTLDRTVIMGRKTYQSIGRALPRRKNVVITRQSNLSFPDCVVVSSLQQALSEANGSDAMVIGGGQIYAQALPIAQVMHLTLVDCDVDGDAVFPRYNANEWVEVFREHHPANLGPPFAFVDLQRQ